MGQPPSEWPIGESAAAMARALKRMKADTRPAEVLTEADRELLRGMGIGSE